MHAKLFCHPNKLQIDISNSDKSLLESHGFSEYCRWFHADISVNNNDDDDDDDKVQNVSDRDIEWKYVRWEWIK